MTDNILKKVQQNLATLGGTNVGAMELSPAIKSLWEERMALKAEMNIAKQAAAAKAAEPYLEALKEIEERYAVLLTLSGGR